MNSDTNRQRKRLFPMLVSVTTVLLLVFAGTAIALESAQGSGSCQRAGKSGECKAYGEIWMDNRAEITGDPVKLKSEVYLNTNFQDMGARWVMFSVRNITWDGANPVWVSVDGFSTQHGNIITTRVDDQGYQVDLWVDVMDLPVGTPINIDMTVGSTDRGAFMVETLMVVFDRGYDPIRDASGNSVVLFASTHLGVNKATESNSGFTSRFQNVPGVEAVAVVAAVALVAAFVFHRRRDQ